MKNFIWQIVKILFANKKIIVISADYVGLGNRIKQLASYHICFGLNDTLMVWSTKGWVDKDFQDLFVLKEVRDFKVINMKFLLGIVNSKPVRKEFVKRGFWRLFVSKNEIDDSFYIKRNGDRFPIVDFCYNRIPLEVISKYLDFFKKLSPSKEVLERMKSIHLLPETVCVFVRNSNNCNDQANVPTIGQYFEVMDKYPSNVNFFLSSMAYEVSMLFCERYGHRIIQLPDKNYNSLVDAVADLYLLGKGQELIVTSGSTFCEVAWWLNGAKQSVVQVFPSFRQGN